jgi:flagellar biosynthesis component FlhA
VTGELGCWLGAEDWDAIRNGGYELWEDPLLFAVFHVEELLRRNLHGILGLQEVDNLLEQWLLDEVGEGLVGEFPADSETRYRLARVLRALVAEGVSIRSWQQILETIGEVGLPDDDVTEVVQQVRLALKPELPGNESGAMRIPLPPEVEAQFAAWIHEQGGKIFLAIPPEPTQQILEAIRDMVGEGNRRQVLVVRSPRVRPFVRRLIELEFPHLMVIAEPELLPLDQSV